MLETAAGALTPDRRRYCRLRRRFVSSLISSALANERHQLAAIDPDRPATDADAVMGQSPRRAQRINCPGRQLQQSSGLLNRQ
jgi:hypothetical protein